MHRLAENSVRVVAADTQAALKSTDQALLAHVQMVPSVLETADGSDLPLAVTQDLHSRIATHGGKLVEGREDRRQLITRLPLVKDRSDQREVATGCPGGALTPSPAHIVSSRCLPELSRHARKRAWQCASQTCLRRPFSGC
ncbi:hypothetical protein [Sphingomonas sp.]|uniref:hypothetical protein n=1 Tax=Sphingomonas sp. TaxID=28214 RepID=UPI0025FCDC7D|nr:hypothetical protein [Sphingomonas sp.]